MSFPSRSPLLLGHRGAPRLARENTIAAFQAALDNGADGLELDLHRTRDGVLAVVHDPTIEGRLVSQHDWSDLRRAATPPPRFEEVLELLAGYPASYLNIELKQAIPAPDDREALLATVLRGWTGMARPNSWVSSFDPYALLRLRREGVDLPLALLVAEPEALDLLPCLPVAGVHPHHSLVSDEAVDDWRRHGLFVFVWTVNEVDLAVRLLDLGVAGLIGDDHEVLREARKRHRGDE